MPPPDTRQQYVPFFQNDLGVPYTPGAVNAAFPPGNQQPGTVLNLRDVDALLLRGENPVGTPAWATFFSGGSGPLTRTLYVDAGSIATSPDGSIAKPFPTITSALAVIPAATNAATARTVWVLLIVGGTYDEDLTIDITGRRIILAGIGPWNLGEFNSGTDWGPSGTRRNVTVTGNAAPVDSIRCSLGLCTLLPLGERYSTQASYEYGCRISGKIDLPLTSGASFDLNINGEVFGTTGDAAGDSLTTVGNPILQVYFYNGRFRGKVNIGSNGNLQHADKVRFDGLLTAPLYALIDRCSIRNGMTVTAAGPVGALLPDGMIDTFWSPGPKTFTGPALSLRLDAYTNNSFKVNGGLLAGGATKVILGDLVP